MFLHMSVMTVMDNHEYGLIISLTKVVGDS